MGGGGSSTLKIGFYVAPKRLNKIYIFTLFDATIEIYRCGKRLILPTLAQDIKQNSLLGSKVLHIPLSHTMNMEKSQSKFFVIRGLHPDNRKVCADISISHIKI
jgi:hypothetical protein